MNSLNDGAALLGRLLLAVIFILSGVQKLMDFNGTVAFMGAEGLPVPVLAAIVAVIVECVGGILLSAIRRVQPGSYWRCGALRPRWSRIAISATRTR